MFVTINLHLKFFNTKMIPLFENTINAKIHFEKSCTGIYKRMKGYSALKLSMESLNTLSFFNEKKIILFAELVVIIKYCYLNFCLKSYSWTLVQLTMQ